MNTARCTSFTHTSPSPVWPVVATCTMIRTFCNNEHATRWAWDHDPERGYIADADTVWRLSIPWYGDRLAPDFQPHTRDHNQGLLEECGLTGPFWRLP